MSEQSKDPAALLQSLRWGPDQVIENHFGERVWLKKIPEGITDCCYEDAPCERHVAIAAARSQSPN